MKAAKSIQIDIFLDSEHIPEKIEWTADDNDGVKTSAKHLCCPYLKNIQRIP